MRASLLIVDDEKSMLEFLGMLFDDTDYEVETAQSVTEARSALSELGPFDLVLCDIYMPDGSGLDLLREIKDDRPETSVIVMTAYTSTKSAIEAMKLGAYDYLSKPFDVDEVKVLVDKALEKTQLVAENVYLRRELEDRYTFNNIIGKSAAMQEIFALVERIARTTSTVLVHGESGTGKELIARAIHYSGPRRERRFLTVNCGAMPENLLESELFGHEKGAFTGAHKQKSGLFHEADGGTLLLDEIGEMTAPMQVKLLRVLQDRTVRRVGSNEEEEVDVRIIAATNKDLDEMLEDGSFREDLYYRINVIPVHLPPLRERREDIPLLTHHFLEQFSERLDQDPKKITADAMAVLESYDWPGNVRELENLVERTLTLSSGEMIEVSDLPAYVVQPQRSAAKTIELPAGGLDLEAYLDRVRADLMTQALERCHGVQIDAAALLGMSARSFRYYARKVGILGAEADEASEASDEERDREPAGA